MKAARTVALRIPGDWSDCFLYKETLLLWSRAGGLYFSPLAALQGAVARSAHAELSPLIDLLLMRNDWLHSAQHGSLMRSTGVRRALLEPIADGDRVIEIESLSVDAVPSPDHDGYLLDVAVYANRVFMATSAGLFETEFNPEYADKGNPTIQTSSASTTSIAVRGSMLAASQGESGLVVRGVELGHGAEWWRRAQAETPRRVDDYSLHVAHTTYDLANYRGAIAPTLLRADTAQVQGNGRFPETVVSDYDDGQPIDDLVRRHLEDESSDGAAESFRVVGNLGHRLLISSDDRAEVANLAAYPGKDVEVNRNGSYRPSKIDPRSVRDALRTHPMRSGFLLEGFNDTAIVTDEGSFRLIDEPRARLRTFPGSRRYNDCFAAIGDGFVDLVGIAYI